MKTITASSTDQKRFIAALIGLLKLIKEEFPIFDENIDCFCETVYHRLDSGEQWMARQINEQYTEYKGISFSSNNWLGRDVARPTFMMDPKSITKTFIGFFPEFIEEKNKYFTFKLNKQENTILICTSAGNDFEIIRNS